MQNAKRKRKPRLVSSGDDHPQSKTSRIDATPLFLHNLHQEPGRVLSDLLIDKNLVFVKGPVGCGKTTLVKRVALELDMPVKVVQLSDQIDSKTFIGHYECTEVPGEFVWKPSAFSDSVLKRCVILLEDLDCASPDLVSCLLLMSKTWSAAFKNDGVLTEFHPELRIVATVRSENNHGESSELIRSNPLTIELENLSTEELQKIVECKFPNLSEISEKLLRIFVEVSEKIKENSLIDRELNSSDLIRACQRLSKLERFNDNHSLFTELAEVFVISVANLTKRFEMARILGSHLSIPDERVEFFLFKNRPDIVVEDSHVKLGRIVLPIRKGYFSGKLSAKNFGLTLDARILIERIAACIDQEEAVLLTGETGVGKTSIVQLIASYMNVPLEVVNMSQDSDSTDLIGGYKPIGTLELLSPFINDMDKLFKKDFDMEKNAKFLGHFTQLLDKDQYHEYLELCELTAKKVIDQKQREVLPWVDLMIRARRLKSSLTSRKSALPFAYVEGVVSKAAKNGHWLLVDEINLASSECLDAVIHVLDGVIERHPDFRLFACMNPATDTGKKKLPVGIRSRFTEFFVQEPGDRNQLSVIVKNYLPAVTANNMNKCLDFYETAVKTFPKKYSLRNLCRALSLASNDLFGNPYRSLFEGLSMAFGSDLDNEGFVKFEELLKKHLNDVPAGNPKPTPGMKQILIEGSYIEQGDKSIEADSHYVYTASVKKNLSKLARIIASGKFPVLIEGETSAGKTSMIMHLASVTGNVVHRINNHEHTDIQEYIGCYAPSDDGKLTFVEGVLLQAVRYGHWVILDELNLAPVEVLEALNRLLDDNRELFVAERNMTVSAHPRFRLFATQNPVGTYAGRKRLSRAFLNRFIVLRFDHPPFDELAQIVCARCAVPNASAVAMIKVLTELKQCRSQAGIFNSSDGLMTLRDLFRWANRLSKSDSGEWRQVLADQGYFLLAARCRNYHDTEEVVRVLERVLKVKIDTNALFGSNSPYLPEFAREVLLTTGSHVVPTYSMRRMLVLCSEAWKCSEPVLLVGETGCGKTTAAQILAENRLLSINCHERTETSDLLGTIRPNSDGSFFWQDGVVVQAMKNGSKLLIDEISLAADSVLERLNPLLEPSRTVLLTDAGADAEIVVAHDEFQVVATMNPGTDHGKKELSKALRNRFTEIWCSCDHPVEDIRNILLTRMLLKKTKLGSSIEKAVDAIVDFFVKFNSNFGMVFRTVFSIRDIVAAADLLVACMETTGLPLLDSLINSLSGVVLDSIGVLPARTIYDTSKVKDECMKMLFEIISQHGIEADDFVSECLENARYFGVFPIKYGSLRRVEPRYYSFDAPTTVENVTRVARALLLEKPIMLEGSPGAGKSSLIVALAQITGYPLVRLNLSDQTDLSDLFGHDVPITRADGSISFQWQDGPVLKAIKAGSWILLDEMNLASQSVLEGLNSCFDFRQELFIAELNKTFVIDSSKCRFFACQNPQQQGGNRRALPKSFLNRFTSIYVEPFNHKDFLLILEMILPSDKNLIKRMVLFNKQIQKFVKKHTLDYEFNMRDLLRWAEFIQEFGDVVMGAEILYVSRFPSHIQDDARDVYCQVFESDYILPQQTVFFNKKAGVCFGSVKYNLARTIDPQLSSDLIMLPSQMKMLQKLAACVKMNWLVLLNGSRLSGKASVVEILTTLSGNKLKRMKLNKETDASELLGTYEQVIDEETLNESVDQFFELLQRKLPDLETPMKLSIQQELIDLGSIDVRSLRFKIDQVLAMTVDGESYSELERLSLKVSNISLRFEWKPSVFVEAFRNGDWLLLDDVNCCSAAVLDRLNSCLESGGRLVLPEQADGSIEEIKPHSNFKIFFTMDSRNGSLSRAMKNRSVEFAVDEANSWYGDTSSALNVLLKKEKTMCATVDEDVVKVQFEKHSDAVKKSLLIAALNKISEADRLQAIDPQHRLQIGSKQGLCEATDKVSLVESGLYSQRKPVNLMHPDRQLRCPLVEVATFTAKSSTGFTTNVLASEMRVQEFDRIVKMLSPDVGFNESEYSLAGFCLALMGIAPEAVKQSTVLKSVFVELDPKDKDLVIKLVQDYISSQNFDISSPWDLRCITNGRDEVIAENDWLLVELLAKWLKLETAEIEKRTLHGSPLKLSMNFNAKKGGSLEHLPYKSLAPVCSSIITKFLSIDFKKLELDTNVFAVVFDFIIDVAILLHAASLNSSDVHQLLIFRQCFQNLDISSFNNRGHAVWRLLAPAFKDSPADYESFEKFIRQLGVSNPVESKNLMSLMESISPVRAYLDEDEYQAVGNLAKDLSEDWTRVKGKKSVEKISLTLLVKGLADFLTSYAVIKTDELAYQNWLVFSGCPLQPTELVSLMHYKRRSDKNTALFLSLVNSKFGTLNICPTLTNYQIVSTEVLIDILCKFWEGFGFSTSTFSAIPIVDLASASERIAEYQSLIWTTRKVYKKYCGVLTSRFSVSTSEYLEPGSHWDVLFKQSNSVFKALVPPKGMIDPALDGIVKLSVARYRESILQLFTSFSNVFPAEHSAHPILRNLHVTFVDTMRSIEKMENEQQKVYRISHLRFDDFAAEFRNFYSRWESVLEGYNVRISPWPLSVALQLVVQFATKTNNMINLANAFCEQLLFSYSDLPDIILPIYSVLQCILVVLHLQTYLNDRYLNLRSIEKDSNIIAAKVCQRVRPSMDIFDDDFGILEFALSGRDGAMPMQFQYEVAAAVLSKKCNNNEMSRYRMEAAFDWLLKEWAQWHEKQKEKRAKMFIYKETGLSKGDDEETMIDPEDLEIQAMLPSLDDDDFEGSMQLQGTSIFNKYPDAQDISNLVQNFMDSKGDTDKFLPTIWLLNMFNHTDALVNPHFVQTQLQSFVDDSLLMDQHLLSLVKFRSTLGSKPLQRVINVYTENDKAEVIRCADAMKKLECRIQEVQSEFPEEANLKVVGETVASFLKLDCGIPQLKLANFVEKVLEKSQLWQKLASRQYTLTEQLNVLQDILLDWRKMQVQSWHHIINSMAKESHAIAVAMGYPLVETVMGWKTLVPSDSVIQNYLAMLIDWIQASTLVDLAARLQTAEFVAKVARMLLGDKFFDFADSVMAIRFYFEAYQQDVDKKLQDKRRSVIQDLDDFVSIVKFHDLNLWSVKNSAEKAHTKLFRIIKKYKLEGNEQLSSVFLDFLPAPEPPLVIDVRMKHTPFAVEDVFNFGNFFVRFSDVLLSIPGVHDSEDLFDLASNYQQILEKDVHYDGADDEANEKLQGKALFDRQRRFAQLIKRTANFGIRSRRATQLSSEDVLKSSLTMDAVGSGLDAEAFRSCAVVRNVVMRLVNQLNATNQPHIFKQVSVQMIGHIRGLTEFGFYWLLNVATTFKKLDKTLTMLKTFKEKLGVYSQISKDEKPCYTLSADLNKLHADVLGYSEKTVEIGNIIVDLVEAAPSSGPKLAADNSGLLIKLENEALHKEHPSYARTSKDAHVLHNLLIKLKSVCVCYGNKVKHDIWIPNNAAFFIAELSDILQSTSEALSSDALKQHFGSRIKDLDEYILLIMDCLKKPIRFETTEIASVQNIDSDIFQKKVQQIYKAVDSKVDLVESPIDVFKKVVLALTNGIEFTKEVTVIEGLIDQLQSGYKVTEKEMTRYYRLTTELYEAMELARSVLNQFANWTAAFYIKLGHVNAHILRKGLVNAIPKKEEGESGGQGKELDNTGGENCGMGEGEGAKDVGSEIEETGQVEDLRDDNDDGKKDEPQDKKKDSETPLEMEDDFAADLENLDAEDNDKGDEDKDEGEDQNEDWDMGDVDQPEEDQLDPLLWDKPKQDDKNLDDKAQGADDNTDELAAKENDDTVPREDDKKENDQDPEEENEEDLENVNQVDANDSEDETCLDKPPEEVNDATNEDAEDTEEAEKLDDDQEDNPEEKDEETMDQNEGEEEENQERSEEDGGAQPEQMEVDEGAEPEEVDQSNQGQSSKDDKKKDSAAGDTEEREMEEDEAQKSENTKEEKTKGRDDRQKSSNAAASVQSEKKNDDEKVDDEEGPSEKKNHAQPTEDEPMEVEGSKDVEEALEDDEIDVESNQVAHIADDKMDSRDQHVVQKSTVEEALSTRSQYEKIKPDYNDPSAIPNREKQEQEPINIGKDEENMELEPEESTRTVIHVSTDFFDLSQQAVSTLKTMEANVDNSAVANNDPKLFSALSDSVSMMASELAENLRQIMEPSIANRLQGDYRTGKRLNMKRLVSYIASDYRKNHIWLRRTKKQQRNFQIMIAVDDSQSMGDNRMGEITCQSVCLIEKAFRQLEIGQLSICKFGEHVQMLRDFTSATDAQDTLIPSLLSNLKFDQNKTDLLGLLAFASKSCEIARENTPSAQVPIQMLVIIGDGHGVFAQGKDPLKAVLKEFEHQRITVLYVIVDGKNSVLKMNYTSFVDGKVVMTPYISMFPFPFYALVRTVSTLPGTLAEAIRQWFEMAMQE